MRTIILFIYLCFSLSVLAQEPSLLEKVNLTNFVATVSEKANSQVVVVTGGFNPLDYTPEEVEQARAKYYQDMKHLLVRELAHAKRIQKTKAPHVLIIFNPEKALYSEQHKYGAKSEMDGASVLRDLEGTFKMENVEAIHHKNSAIGLDRFSQEADTRRMLPVLESVQLLEQTGQLLQVRYIVMDSSIIGLNTQLVLALGAQLMENASRTKINIRTSRGNPFFKIVAPAALSLVPDLAKNGLAVEVSLSHARRPLEVMSLESFLERTDIPGPPVSSEKIVGRISSNSAFAQNLFSAAKTETGKSIFQAYFNNDFHVRLQQETARIEKLERLLEQEDHTRAERLALKEELVRTKQEFIRIVRPAMLGATTCKVMTKLLLERSINITVPHLFEISPQELYIGPFPIEGVGRTIETIKSHHSARRMKVRGR